MLPGVPFALDPDREEDARHEDGGQHARVGDGTFVFEMARLLQTGDPQDAQFALGGTAFVALAYRDGNEGAEGEGGGWTDAGHVTSADEGWIEIVFAR